MSEKGFWFLHSSSNIVYTGSVRPVGRHVIKYWYVNNRVDYEEMKIEAKKIDTGCKTT